MALIEREVGIAIAATATALSPKAREAVRRGAVYGLAGVIKAGDVVVGTARGAARGAAQGFTGRDGAPATEGAQEAEAGAGEQTSAEPVRRRRGGARRQQEEGEEES
ncbi:MAG TPA: hypothetical protein VE997_02175 [Candidatus Limnocylindria bacterium]|jgi:hypothetical protein|nr:hypothetical protein [Candidatus Limnocylindria bacterium]